MNFNDLITKKEILRVIEENGYTNPTEIQSKVMPLIREGYDVLGESQTGTGKTLAFSAILLDKMQENRTLQTLILAPTRELAIQISREIDNLGKYTSLSSTCVYGSSSIEEQIKKIKLGSEIVIGTPGRVKDLIKRKVLKLENINYFILDEADEMLSMGFEEDIKFIFEHTNVEKQVLLFSATMPKLILALAEEYMNADYKKVSVILNEKTSKNIEQKYYLVNENSRLESMCRTMDYYNPKKAIIFCRTKRNADDAVNRLSKRGYDVDVIHGDITQGQRIAVLDRFKAGLFNYLIATDVAARGIHVDDVDIVINYNLPESNEAYVHRIGRTGRVNKSGLALTFITPSEEKIIFSIEREINAKIIKDELPSKESILTNRIDIVIEDIKNISTSSNNYFNSYLNNLTKEELINILESKLESNLFNNLGSDFKFDVSLISKKKRKKSENINTTRVFVTVGKMDGAEKRDLLSFIEKTAKVPENTCESVEILTKFTFMNIKNEYLDMVMKKCNNVKYKNRIVRIEKAKK